MTPILHDALPHAPWADPVGRKLPGTRAAGPDDWLQTDEAYAGQMALRDRLIGAERHRVIACLPEAAEAAAELLEAALERLARLPGHRISDGHLNRPDGVAVTLDRADPMATLGRIAQSDLCILQSRAGEHVLTGAALCFPAGWTLSEKLGRPMTRIHAPVRSYDPAIAARIQRMFDNLKPGRPIWRANAHRSHDPTLFRPRREADPRPPEAPDPPYVRSERQVLFRLPRTGAIVFSIHTFMVRRSSLTPAQAEALAEHPIRDF